MTGIWTALRLALVAMVSAPALFGGAEAAAQERWPSRPVTLVVPVGAGTITDVAGRLLADHLKEAFGQPFVVENKPGAGATLGARSCRARSAGRIHAPGGRQHHPFVGAVAVQEPSV